MKVTVGTIGMGSIFIIVFNMGYKNVNLLMDEINFLEIYTLHLKKKKNKKSRLRMCLCDIGYHCTRGS